MKKSAFTLVEVLMTLIITGMILGFFVRLVVFESQNQERKMGYVKAINTLNNAFASYSDRVTTDYEQICNGKKIGLLETCLDSNGNPTAATINKVGSSYKDVSLLGHTNLDSNDLVYENVFKPHISIIKEGLDATDKRMAGCPSGAKYFYTTDGMRYCFNMGKGTTSYDVLGDFTYGEMWVDVNGNQMPNATSSSPGDVGDTFPIVIMKNRFIPGNPNDYEASRIGQAIFFAQDEKN